MRFLQILTLLYSFSLLSAECENVIDGVRKIPTLRPGDRVSFSPLGELEINGTILGNSLNSNIRTIELSTARTTRRLASTEIDLREPITLYANGEIKVDGTFAKFMVEDESIGELLFQIEGRNFEIVSLQIDELHTGKGVGTQLVQHILDANPNIATITSTPIVNDNKVAFLNGVLKELNVNFLAESSESYLVSLIEDYGPQIRNMTQEQRDDLVVRALKHTPYYKIRRRTGFPNICPGTLSYLFQKNEFSFIHYTACR